MKYKLSLCYDGGRYKGWQKQKSTDNTVQGKIEAVLTKLLDQPVEISGCGRTDAGVHARFQVCSFAADTDMKCGDILDGLRTYLPEDIGAISLEAVNDRFHARLSCKEKTYVYRIWNADTPNVFERKYTYRHPQPLNIEEMRKAAEQLVGTHDFISFSSVKKSKKTTVRSIYKIEIEKADDVVSIAITGNGFLYNMVRIIAGTLIETGEGKRDAGSIREILDGKRRESAGFTAPSCGLFLWDIKY